MADDILDPTGFDSQPQKTMAPRLSTLQGKTIGLLDIGFPNGNVFLDRVEAVLKTRYGVSEVVRKAKPSPARPGQAGGAKGADRRLRRNRRRRQLLRVLHVVQFARHRLF